MAAAEKWNTAEAVAAQIKCRIRPIFQLLGKKSISAGRLDL